MARRGQVGTLAISGKWHVLRFWKYPANGETRIHASEHVCPVDPCAPGYLSKGERRRKANAILEESGVNDAQQFVEVHHGVTFEEQAKWFLNHVSNRKRKPVKTGTLFNWRNWTNGCCPTSGICRWRASTTMP